MMIVSYLSVVESADFLFLQSHTGLTAGNLSSHLSKLEGAGYVDIQKSFVGKKQHTKLSLTPTGRAAFETYRKQMKELLA
jgi:DNA-binding MarR family transcriptional regulator